MKPTREREKELLHQYLPLLGRDVVLAGVDEVGRGSLAGPVCVGIAIVTSSTSDDFPAMMRDSKQLTPKRREELVPQVKQWVNDSAVGYASSDFIDRYGIVPALGYAASVAVDKLKKRGHSIDVVLLDGNHNWWINDSKYQSVFHLPDVPVYTQVRGDASCAVIAAASVVAKVERDAYMTDISQDFPEYEWHKNKGYSSPKHIEALKKHGVSTMHRQSWKMPGIDK
ncbi:MAG: ribonuclease HII [Actinomycetaceae bacterium]|nr:ribonuclease HII [Actinomycetaceae bacterium]